MNRNLSKAAAAIKSGKIIIFPTDTAFGIGCRIDDPQAIKKLFALRKRPKDKAVPILASSIAMVEEYVREISPDARRLMIKYWPGGLTIVLKCQEDMVPSEARGGGITIGIRIPNHSSTLKLIRSVGVPILAPSANFAGEPTPYFSSKINPDLIKLVDYVMPGRISVKKSSTVIDCSTTPFKILREGAVRLNKQITQ